MKPVFVLKIIIRGASCRCHCLFLSLLGNKRRRNHLKPLSLSCNYNIWFYRILHLRGLFSENARGTVIWTTWDEVNPFMYSYLYNQNGSLYKIITNWSVRIITEPTKTFLFYLLFYLLQYKNVPLVYYVPKLSLGIYCFSVDLDKNTSLIYGHQIPEFFFMENWKRTVIKKEINGLDFQQRRFWCCISLKQGSKKQHSLARCFCFFYVLYKK